ncbi:hypothetical protein BBJ28_00014818 [Nothophytophthora sp. Chile5]|nr:hypothetical protein BBJ28_00014818 [Nothophytophthora sp. Chile5]
MSEAVPSANPAQTSPSADKKEKEAVPATVVGIEKDALYGARVRKSFGSRVFWGTIVGCYWITAGLFYKVSFDDGDVDILAADEALEDAKQVSAANNSVVALCRRSSHEEDALRRSKANAATDSTSSAPPTYYNEMRHHRLKRKREDPVDTSRENIRRVRLWGQRLYASIFTNENKETFVKELLKTDDGQMGEMEATGQVAVGDMILAINGTRALGLTSGQVSDLIRHVPRPISIVFLRPRLSETAQRLAEEKQASEVSAANGPAPITTQRPQPPPVLHGSMQLTRPSPGPTPNQQSETNHYRMQGRPQPPGPAANGASPFPPSTNSFISHQPQAQPRQGGPQPQQIALNERILAHSRQMMIQNPAFGQVGHPLGYSSGPFAPANVNQLGSSYQMGTMPSNPGLYFRGRQGQLPQGNAGAITSLYPPSAMPHQAARPQLQADDAVRFVYNAGRNQWRRVANVETARRQANLQTPELEPPPVQLADSAQFSAVPPAGQPAPDASVRQFVASNPSNAASSSALVVRGPLDTRSAAGAHPLGVNPPQGMSGSLQGMPAPQDEPKPQWRIASSQSAATGGADRDSRAASAENSPGSSSDVAAVPFGVRSTVDVDADAAAIAAFAEPDLEGTDDVAASAEMSRTTSFLSPHESSFVSSLPSTLDPVATSSASTSRSSGTSEAEGRSVSVRIHHPRLFLTLGSQGSFVAVTSFIRNEGGQCGEIEASGKVFIGDVLVAINDTRIRPMATPGEVARVVNAMSRPLDLSFERASWDVLEGRE